jgi:hypothetical protein
MKHFLYEYKLDKCTCYVYQERFDLIELIIMLTVFIIVGKVCISYVILSFLTKVIG